jgi:hypothetical protein
MPPRAADRQLPTMNIRQLLSVLVDERLRTARQARHAQPDSGDGGRVAAKPEELVRLAGTKFRTVFGRRCPEFGEPGRVSGVPR